MILMAEGEKLERNLLLALAQMLSHWGKAPPITSSPTFSKWSKCEELNMSKSSLAMTLRADLDKACRHIGSGRDEDIPPYLD
jgi:hypothetical protein